MEYDYQNSVKQWWLSVTAGFIYIILGIWVLLFPVTSYMALKTYFIMGFGALGILNIYYVLINRKKIQHWRWNLMSGIIDIIITFLLIIKSELTLFVLPIYVGFVLMFRSIIGIGFSTFLAHAKVRNWGIVLALSILGAFFSLVLVWEPRVSGFTLAIYTGLALLTAGFAQIGIAYELRRYKKLFGNDDGDT